MNTRTIGSFYEDAACDYLRRQGVVILERNFRCRQGEIDIIGKEGECVVFFEVKYRRNDNCGEALAAVPYRKQKKICRCAQYYCIFHPWVSSMRYDVIGITDTNVEWVKDAFYHIGYSWG